MNKIIIFDITGCIAHFRKFYTNSSSLSYAFPPRTTIIGLIAAILGYERDSYYDLFSSKNCQISVSIKQPFRKFVQTVNYIRTKTIQEITGSGGHTQIPVEFILPLNSDTLQYRIYFTCKDESLYNSLLQRLNQAKIEFPVYLGITECIGHVQFCCEAEIQTLQITENTQFELSSVIPINKILAFPEIVEGYKYIKEDRVPLEFNSERRLISVSSYLLEQNCNKVKVIIKQSYLKDVLLLKYFDKSTQSIISENVIVM